MEATYRRLGALAAAGGLLIAAGCSDRGAAPPEPGEGAVGTVAVDNAGAAQNPQTPALSGGPAGQTPDYPAPGGVSSRVESGPGVSPPSEASGDPPLN